MFHGSVLKWNAPVRLKLPNSWTQRSEYMRSLHCCCLYLPTLYLKILVSNVHFYKHKMYKTCKANEIASSYHCFLWRLPMVEEGRFFSVLQRIISSSVFEVRCVALRHDLGLTFLYIEKTWIPMQWCWSNLRCRSYPIVFLIFWNRDGEVGGISSLRARDLVCSGSDVKALQ